MSHTKFPFKKRVAYKFEQFLSKGGVSIFWSLLVTFLFAFCIILSIRAGIVYFGLGIENASGYNNVHGFFDHMYFVFLEMTDPGNMYQDHLSSPWIKLTTILAGVVGVIILSALIAFITTAIDQLLYNFKKGRGQVLEDDFTLILGWSYRVLGIIRELILANESDEKGVIVIMTLEDNKEEIDEILRTSIKDYMTTRVVVTHGDPTRLRDLDRINAQLAKSIIVMSCCEEMSVETEKVKSDVHVLKTLIAINSFFKDNIEIPIVGEIFDNDKRELVKTLDNENIITIDVWSIIGKLLMQTSLTSGLITVYNELFSFDGGEMYYYYDKNWVGQPFADLIYHMKDGIPLGVCNENNLMLRPEEGYIMKENDEIILLAEDDSTIAYSKERLFNAGAEHNYTPITLEQSTKRMLFIGWHNVGETLITEANDYLPEGSTCDIMLPEPNEKLEAFINEIDLENTNVKLSINYKNPLIHKELASLNPFDYDVVMVLANKDEESSSDEIDSHTLLISMMLGRMKNQLGDKAKKTKLISQVLMADNQELMPSSELDEFIVSNKYTTMILALLSEEPRMQLFYDDILQEDGSEIYLKDIDLYFEENELPKELSFTDILLQANKRDEICLGIRKYEHKSSSEHNFGIRLNIDKNEMITLEPNDQLVVLAEDEL